MGCAQPKPKPPQPTDQTSKPLQSNPAGNASSQVKPNNANSSITDKQINQNEAKQVNNFGGQGSGVQGYGIQGSGVKQFELPKQNVETVQYRQYGASWGNSGISDGKASNGPASGFKPTNNQFKPTDNVLSEAKNSQLNAAQNSPYKNQRLSQSANRSENQNKYGSQNFNKNESIHKKTSQLSKHSNYESIKKQNRDDDGFVPEDSLMDYGQTTITDPSKIEVHFHI